MESLINLMRFNFLYVDKYSFGRTWVYPEGCLPYSMLRYIVEGEAEFCLEGEKMTVSKGQVIYLPQGSRLSCRALVDNFTFISIRFTTPVFYKGADFLFEYYKVPRTMDGGEVIKEFFYDTYERAQSNSPAKMFFLRGNLELIIGNMIQYVEGEVGKNIVKERHGGMSYSLEEIKKREERSNIKEDSRIRIVTEYILMHPTEKFTTQRLCEMADVAETTFRRLFKQQTGKTATEYIREIRLTTAARKLLVSNAQISNIAYEVGFEDPNHFIRVFKKAFGMTPKEYRKIAMK